MPYHTITLDVADGIGRIVLNRPEVRNALNTRMRAELTDALRRAAQAARVVVLTGAGEAFCSGQDLGEGATVAEADLERILAEEYVPLLRAIHDCPVPTIAAVNGAAAGAGANLALTADVVIAAESAVFLQAFSRIGLIPDAGGSYWLPRTVGLARAMGAVLFAEPVPARQAAEWGMIWEAVPDGQFEAHVAARAGQLAGGPTVAYRLAKQALRQSHANTLDAQLELEGSLQAEAGRSRDFAEGVMAFIEKRRPVFEGR